MRTSLLIFSLTSRIFDFVSSNEGWGPVDDIAGEDVHAELSSAKALMVV